MQISVCLLEQRQLLFIPELLHLGSKHRQVNTNINHLSEGFTLLGCSARKIFCMCQFYTQSPWDTNASCERMTRNQRLGICSYEFSTERCKAVKFSGRLRQQKKTYGSQINMTIYLFIQLACSLSTNQMFPFIRQENNNEKTPLHEKRISALMRGGATHPAVSGELMRNLFLAVTNHSFGLSCPAPPVD